MKKLLVLFLFVLQFSVKSHSQNNMSASFGFGLPELVNAGVQYQLSPMKFGMSIGTAFAGFYALSGDVYYHFSNPSRAENLSPWFLRANVSYWPFGKFLLIDLGEVVMIGFRAGREIKLEESLGLRMDAGITPFTFLSGSKVPFSFIPGFSISLYYKFDDIFREKY